MSTGRRRARSFLAARLAVAAAWFVAALASAPLAGAGAPAGPGPRFRILAPTENAVLPPGEIFLIGAASGTAVSMVQVAVDGKLVKLVTANGGAFWCRLLLPPGKHAIRVASGGDEAAVRVSAAPGGEYRFHPKVDACEGCHTRRGGPYKPDVPLPKMCGKCHKPRDSGRFVHGPVAAGGCTACHDPHGAQHRGLQKVVAGCFSCHPPFPEAGWVHEPLKHGECVCCHSPHSADDRALLVMPGNAMCVSCHREFHPYHRAIVKEGSMTRVPEGFPRDKGALACAGCHAPHQSDEEHLLKVKAERLCKLCHG